MRIDLEVLNSFDVIMTTSIRDSGYVSVKVPMRQKVRESAFKPENSRNRLST